VITIANMGSLSVKYYEVDIVKAGKISKHTSTTKGKKYSRGKIYLPDDSFTGRRYQLMKKRGYNQEKNLGE